MARTLYGADNLVGKIVYEPFSPAHVGIIVRVGRNLSTYAGGEPHLEVFVRWLRKGKLSEPEAADSWQLNDYEALTEDHERKAKKFRDIINVIVRASMPDGG